MVGTTRFEILGPQRAWQDGRELDLGPGKQRAVLAVLLLNAGAPVSASRIVDAVWADDPPANGPNVVQKYVAGLRRVLEPDRSPRTPGQVLSLTDAGYLLRVGPDDVDALCFEQRTRRAQVARAEGRWQDAGGELRAALDLWRGEPLQGLTGSFFDASRHRLVETWSTALETWAEWELRLAHHQEVVGELGRHVPQFPVRERLRYLFMVALYRCGRQAEALASFREIRSLLRDEHGLEPGEPLQELHRRILRSDPALMPVEPDAGRDTLPAPTVAGAPPSTTDTVVTPDGLRPDSAPAGDGGAPADPLVPDVAAPTAEEAPGVVTPAGSPPPSVMPVAPTSVPSQGWSGRRPGSGFAGPTHDNFSGPAVYGGTPSASLPLPPLRTVRRRPLWISHLGTVLAVLGVGCTFGIWTWLVFFVYAVRRRSWWLGAAGTGYLAVAICFALAVQSMDPDPDALPTDAETLGLFGGLLIGWLGGIVHVVLINRAILAIFTGRPVESVARADAEQRMRREQARYLLYHYPAARELRIGRPDLPDRFDDGGLVDINAVPEQVVDKLPGLSREQRRQIHLDRWLRGPYASLEDLVGRCLLPMDVADTLRELLVFVPPVPSVRSAPSAPPPSPSVYSAPPAYPVPSARPLGGAGSPSD